MISKRLEQQLKFILEMDQLKQVIRRSYLIQGNRRENSAEHSWHVALMAMVLMEYANESVNLQRVIELLLVHDIVEIDAGDTYIYDVKGNIEKTEREKEAANKLFNLLPDDQGKELITLWEEFESAETPESHFAHAIDRLMPMLHNYHTEGRSWKEHGINSEKVFERNSDIKDGSQILWEYGKSVIEESLRKGYLKKE